MSAPTITRRDLARYEREGWTVTNRCQSEHGGRNYEVLSLRGPSSVWEDVGRSVGYTVGAPVVFALSLAGSVLAIGCGAMACCAGGTVIEERGTTRYARYDPKQAEFARTMTEGCCCEVPCGLISKMNVGFFEWAQPYQSRMLERTVRIPEENH